MKCLTRTTVIEVLIVSETRLKTGTTLQGRPKPDSETLIIAPREQPVMKLYDHPGTHDSKLT